MDKKTAVSVIKKYAVNGMANGIAEKDREHFVEVVKTELMNLHAGNIARYRISLAQFGQWNRAWG